MESSGQKARKESIQAYRKIKEEALAKKHVLAAAEREGKLISKESALLEWTQALAKIRDRVLQMPERLTPQLVGTTDPAKIRSLIRTEAEDALRGLAENAV
jgi:hypothetical protein